MAQVWQPPDITPICAEAHAPLTQCSHTGYMFLALVTQLFGGSVDLPKNPYDNVGRSFEYGTSPYTSSQFSQPATEIPLGPVIPRPFEEKREYGGSFFKPDFKFDFERENFESSQPVFDFNYGPKSFYEFEAADSKKVENIAMKSRSKRKKRQSIEEYDFIIVGAGSAGCVVANRLSEVKKWKILLLEAGPEEPDITSVPAFAATLGRSNIDWNYRTQPEELSCRAQRGQTCAWLRGRSMGGSSAINYMIYMRGNRRDYDEWAEMGNRGWSYQEVLPYFKKSENNQDVESHDKLYHSVGGPLNVERFSYVDIPTMMVVQAFKEKGLPVTDFNGDQQIGTDIAQSTGLNGRRMSANVAFIRPIRGKRFNLHVLSSAFVTKILIDPHTRTAYGVEYIRDGHYHVAYANKEVIISSGSLNSPKLLMLSGVGPKEHLSSLGIPVLADLRVGSNLQDHVTTDSLVLSLSNRSSTMVSSEQVIGEVYDYYSQPTKKIGPLSSSCTINGVGFIKTEPGFDDIPDIQFHFDGRNVEDFYSDPTSYLASNVLPLSFYDGLAARPLLLTPQSRGYVLLNHTNPIFGQPLIYPRFFTVKKDMDILIAGLQFAISMEETEAFQKSGARYVRVPVGECAGYTWGSYEYFTCLLTHYTSTIYHPVGTCKMGPNWDHEAVVDPRLRVYGIKKLRVIDASIMPKIVRGNTNAPTIMIGERASDFIKEEWLLEK